MNDSPTYSMTNRRADVLRFFAGINADEFLIITPTGSVVGFQVSPGQTLDDELGKVRRILKEELNQ